MKEKIKKVYLILGIIILILIGIAITVWILKQIGVEEKEENLTLCKTFKCQYNPSQNLWEFVHISLGIERYFPTQEQCMDYCINQLEADAYLKKELKNLYEILQ